MPNPRSRPARRSLLRAAGAAFTLVTLVAVMPGTAAAATPPITFNLDIFGQCIEGQAAPNASISIVWRDAQGGLKASGTTQSAAYLGWSFCSTVATTWLASGDRIKVSDGSYTRKYVVPELSMKLDRISDLATGTGPAGRTVRVCSTWARFGDYEKCHSVRVGQDGRWSFNPQRDIDGGTSAELYWKSPNNDYLHVSGVGAELTVTIGKAGFSGQTTPRTAFEVLVDGGASSGQAKGNEWGIAAGKLRDANGHLAPVAVGDHVSAPSLASDVDWIVPGSEASANVTTDVVTGTCEDAGLRSDVAVVEVYRTGHRRGWAWTSVDSDGHFTVDFSERAVPTFDPANIKHGDRLVIGCMLTTTDFVNQSFMVP